MTNPEIKAVVLRRVEYLRRQLDAAEEFLRSLEEQEELPATAPKRRAKTTTAKHRLAQNGMTHREYVRKLLLSHEEGLAPIEMRTIAEQAGRTLPKSFPYAQLTKLKRDKEVRSSGGKYFATKTTGAAA